MRIAFFTNNPRVTGTTRPLAFWIEMGERDGWRPCIVCPETGHLSSWADLRGIPVFTDKLPWPDKKTPWQFVWHFAKVWLWLSRRGVDIVVANEHDVYPFMRFFKRIWRKPAVCWVRCKVFHGFAAWAFKGMYSPDILIWTSNQQKFDCAQAIGELVPEEKQIVVPLAIDTTSFGCDVNSRKDFRRKFDVHDNELVVGIACAFRPGKRVEDYIEVMRRICNDCPNVVGLISGRAVPGDESYGERIENLVLSSGLGRRLRFIGFQHPIEPFHQACDVAVSTSEYETFGMSVCEAMACGKPVVAYAGGSVAEVVSDTGIIVTTGDIDALEQGIRRLIADQDLRVQLGCKARERVVQCYDASVSFKKLNEIYSKLCQHR